MRTPVNHAAGIVPLHVTVVDARFDRAAAAGSGAVADTGIDRNTACIPRICMRLGINAAVIGAIKNIPLLRGVAHDVTDDTACALAAYDRAVVCAVFDIIIGITDNSAYKTAVGKIQPTASLADNSCVVGATCDLIKLGHADDSARCAGSIRLVTYDQRMLSDGDVFHLAVIERTRNGRKIADDAEKPRIVDRVVIDIQTVYRMTVSVKISDIRQVFRTDRCPFAKPERLHLFVHLFDEGGPICV